MWVVCVAQILQLQYVILHLQTYSASAPPSCTGKQLALLHTNSAVRTCGFDFSGNIIMFSTDKQMGYQCFLNFFDLRDPQQIGTYQTLHTD